MTVSKPSALHQSLPVSLHQPLLHYLNLPPVGCIADHHAGSSAAAESVYELPENDRIWLAAERQRLGGSFRHIGELEPLHAAKPLLFPSIGRRLEDITRYGNRVQPVWGGPTSRKAYLQLLEGAERYIHLSTYILGGQAGVDIIRLLKEKMEDGVEVRMLFCLSGLVLSGSPSGTGFVSHLSAARSYLVNDLYARKRILAELAAAGVPFRDSSPIGCHWRRLDMRQRGIGTEEQYYKWARGCEMPEAWLAEQQEIDRQCRIGFVNVDHRKMTIVDGDRAFIGSQNLADSYFYDNELHEDAAVNRRNWQWHDGSAIVEGGCVHQLADLFAMRWWLSGGDQFDYEAVRYKPKPVRRGNACVTTMATIPGAVRVPFARNLPGFLLTGMGARCDLRLEGNNPVREWLKRLPQFAEHSMLVNHCYPSDRELLQGWASRGDRSCRLRMIVPGHYDVVFLGMECDANFPSLIAAGAEIYAYRRAILHAKLILVDGYYAVTGSYNINVRSSRADMECTFFIQCPEFGRLQAEQFARDLTQSEPVRPSPLARFRSRCSIPVVDAILRYLFF